MSKTSLRVSLSPQDTAITLLGNWDFQTDSKHLKELSKLLEKYSKNPYLVIDFSEVSRIDFIFASFLFECLHKFSIRFHFINLTQKASKILETFQTFSPKTTQTNFDKNSHTSSFGKFSFLTKIFSALGGKLAQNYGKMLDFFSFTGLSLYFLFQALLHPKRIRLSSLFYHINESGFKALPVSLATALIVGTAITYQGAIQLQSLGAPLASIDTTAKLSLREMGPFILALIVAGRSASSFTAQIGVMKITEEINAMKTMGFNLFDFIVIPRILALMIAMPLLVFLNDIFTLLGGMLAIKYQLDIGFSQYIERFYETVNWNHFWVGIIKAPFFGLAIAMVGIFRGFEVRGGTEEIGRLTTISVVNALFWIIFINAVFSIVFTRIQI